MKNKFMSLNEEQRRLVFVQTAAQKGINPNLTEKDWWICKVLKALYSLDCGSHLCLKGLCIAAHNPFYVQKNVM